MYNPELSLAIRHFETQDGSRLDDRMGLTLVNAVKDAIDERDALRAENERLREALETAIEAMAERRGYAEMWEYKYGETWDEEDEQVRAALKGEA